MVKEDQIIAELFLSLKGSKDKRQDWITIAEKCKQLVKISKNRNDAAKKVGVSSELIRSILNLLELPDEVQNLIQERKILFDAAQRLMTIRLINKEKTDKKRTEVAAIIVGLRSHEQREIIQFAKKFPKDSLLGYKKRVTKSRAVKEIHIAVIPLNESLFELLNNHAKRKKQPLEKIIHSILSEWSKKR